MSAAERAYFDDFQRELTRDPDHHHWLAVTAEPKPRGTDMNINEVFPSEFLKASDLQGKKLKLQIERVELRELGTDQKPVIFFTGKEKGLVLNKTNAQVIASAFSPETDGWIGKEVGIYATKVAFQGQMVDALRVEVVAPDAGPNDDIPF